MPSMASPATRSRVPFGIDQKQEAGGQGIRLSVDWVVMRAPAV